MKKQAAAIVSMRSVRKALQMSALALSMALAVTSASGAGVAALANPGFDLPPEQGRPPGWAIEAAAVVKGRVSLLDGVPGASGRVLELEPNDKNTGDKLIGFGQLVDAKAWRGRDMPVQVVLGAGGGATAIVGVHLLGGGRDLGHVQFRQADSGGALRTQQQTLAVPASAETIVVYVTTDSRSGTALFDAVTLGGVSKAPTAGAAAKPAAAPTADAAGAAAVVVTVDPKRVLRQIPETIYGTNAEWIFDGQGLWSAAKQSLDPGALAQVKQLSPTVIRFPGGVFSDLYHWRDGVGPQGSRPSTANFPGGPVSRHSVGTQEIAEVARAAGSELMLTVNAGTGTAREAAEWVAYARANVQPRVRLWEVGNELYMKDDLSGASMSARKYARTFKEFAREMRAADPEIRVGAIGGLNAGRYRFMSDDRWTEILLSEAAAHIDFLAVHNAYAPLVIGVSPDTDPKAVYRAMFAAPTLIEANLKALSALIARHESPQRPVALAVTEWGPSFHLSPDSPWVDHVKTMGSALFVASTLNVFVREPRMETANFFKLTDLGFMGWIGLRAGTWTPTLPAMAFGLYRQRLGRTLVHSSLASPRFDSHALGAIAAVRGVPWVDAVATYDDGKLVVMLVNRSDTLTLDTELLLRGVRRVGQAQADGFSAESLDANTGTELPQIPGLKWARQVDLGRHAKGAPSEVRVIREAVTARIEAGSNDAGTRLVYRLKPLSIVALTFDQVALQ